MLCTFGIGGRYCRKHVEVWVILAIWIIIGCIQQQENVFIHHYQTVDSVDVGKYVHERVHGEYDVEIAFNLDSHVCVRDAEVVLTVQCPSRVGGIEDHFSWNTGHYFMKKFHCK